MTDRREGTLFALAGLFMLLFAAALMLSPAARENSWQVPFQILQWIDVALWGLTFLIGVRLVHRYLPKRDPYLLPLAALLSGWGILTITRLDSGLGSRQGIWLAVCVVALVLIARQANVLGLLRQFKYVLLGSGLILTALTLFFGTNPAGTGPRLWLGCCGIYLQPSEPLKLLLVVYLAAYLADQARIRAGVFPLLLPTVLVTGLALVLLLVQRDLGTASIFILLPTVMLYLATDRARVLLASGIGLAVAGLVGFFFIDIVHARLDSWINPWTDPSGRSYQVIQSLLAVANGGLLGRGPGLGSPTLVPVAQSDFIYSAITEETGLLGGLGLLLAYLLFLVRGVRIALMATDDYRRLLAAGLTAHIGIQTILIVGGNLRALPLTGVTLPFVAYGGSSLLTSFVAAGLLLKISSEAPPAPAPIRSARPYYVVAALLTTGILASALIQGWWSVVRSNDLLSRTDNPRRSIADRFVRRGGLFDRANEPIDVTVGESGSYGRRYLYPEFGPISGYTHPIYGQAGLEASLDDYLRGLQGNPASLIWWDQLVYGTPPPGLDVRLSIDLGLQRVSDQALGELKGAVVLINAHSGEILAMASHPTYDPNRLDEIGPSLASELDAPLLNRASQGAYALGPAADPFFQAAGIGDAADGRVTDLYRRLGFYQSPQLRMPTTSAPPPGKLTLVRISPLQMAIAAASLSNGGVRPAPRIATAVDTPQGGWVILPSLTAPEAVFPEASANNIAHFLTAQQSAYWEYLATAQEGGAYVTWYIAGTVPDWKGTPVAVAVLLEANDPTAAQIGRHVLGAALKP